MPRRRVNDLESDEARDALLPKLTPRELRDRYPIEGPVNESADRYAWEAEAAAAVKLADEQ